jgi:hypothetical protein
MKQQGFGVPPRAFRVRSLVQLGLGEREIMVQR